MKNREEQELENNWNRNYLKSISNLLGKVQFLKLCTHEKISKKKYQENDNKRTMSINISYSLCI